jgi:single-stranded-DNA-specific exonuclease
MNAMENQGNILILGDYDTDGATAAALGLTCIRAMGGRNVDYLVPNRFEFGYGLSPEIARVALDRAPDLVITVDNGINSLEGVSLLKDNGVGVIITDHHLAGRELPAADAIVNPNQPGCRFPSKMLSGVGVVFYLMMLVRSRMRESGWFDSNKIPVVADVVPLDYNNRILVAQGLNRIRAGRCRLGILALMEVAGRHYGNTVSSDLGFVIAPRLNAAGRLEDISTGVECLCADNGESARKFAAVLDQINKKRKKIEQQMQQRAMTIVTDIVSSDVKLKDKQYRGFCLYEPGWHQGITGLVASRIKDRTGQPVIAFADIGEGKMSGSARSVEGLHIKDLLERIVTGNPGLILKFGGHAMAAGLTIEAAGFQIFVKQFQRQVSDYFEENLPDSVIVTDGELDENEITLDNAESLRTAAPWGQGFPPPLFDGLFKVVSQSIVGDSHLRLKVRPANGGRIYEAIAFRAIEPGQELQELNAISAVYQLDVNEYRGDRKLQLIIEHLAPIYS